MKRLFCVALLFVLMASSRVFAQDEGEIQRLKQENVELKQRIEALEQSLGEVQQLLKTSQPETSEEKPIVHSTHPIEVYGFIKFDAAYDSQRTDNGNFARWVESEEFSENDDQFNMTARETRLGLKLLSTPVGGDMTASGRVEVDFYEGGSENKARLMMRHAYLQMDWPHSDFSILAGQTSDVISPLNPSTLNYSVAWWVGNIGYRRPQFRLTKGFKLGDEYRLVLEGAASRTIGDDVAFDPGDTGEDAGFPTLQGRTALTFPGLRGPAAIGVSGHWGREELDEDNADNNEDLDSWSLNLDLAMPLSSWLAFKGELWTGENLDDYLGGVGQGVNLTSFKEIESTGGWAALTIGPFGKWQYNVGAGMDDPDDSDLAANARSRNYAAWANAIYSIHKDLKAGLELSYWDTAYEDIEDGDSVRVQTSLMYFF